jgi:hypothetical protein
MTHEAENHIPSVIIGWDFSASRRLRYLPARRIRSTGGQGREQVACWGSCLAAGAPR